ncbi:MAG: tetratricopeptide repeat protein, partial [Isosphaeraceae bacterium]
MILGLFLRRAEGGDVVSLARRNSLGIGALGAASLLAVLLIFWALQGATVPPPDLDAARSALEARRWDEVEARLGPWNVAHPEDGDAAVMLGFALMNRGRLDEATRVLDAIPDRHPARGQAQALLAEAAIQAHDLPEAERRLRAAVERDPKAEPPRQRLIYLLSLQQRHGEARDQLWEMYRRSGAPAALFDLVERLWAHDDDVRGLVPAIEAFLKVTPDDPFTRRAMGLSLLYQGRPAEALPHLEAACLALENDPTGRFALAECQLALGTF